MRISKRSHRNKGLFGVEQAGDAVDLRRLDCFIQRERRDDGRYTFGQHRLSRTRGTDHQHVVPASDRHLDGALDVALTFHVAEIDLVTLMRGEKFAQISTCWQKRK